MSEELIARWMDDRACLSEEEAAELAWVLSADPDLARVIDVWPELSPHIRAAVLALVGTAR